MPRPDFYPDIKVIAAECRENRLSLHTRNMLGKIGIWMTRQASSGNIDIQLLWGLPFIVETADDLSNMELAFRVTDNPQEHQMTVNSGENTKRILHDNLLDELSTRPTPAFILGSLHKVTNTTEALLPTIARDKPLVVALGEIDGHQLITEPVSALYLPGSYQYNLFEPHCQRARR